MLKETAVTLGSALASFMVLANFFASSLQTRYARLLLDRANTNLLSPSRLESKLRSPLLRQPRPWWQLSLCWHEVVLQQGFSHGRVMLAQFLQEILASMNLWPLKVAEEGWANTDAYLDCPDF